MAFKKFPKHSGPTAWPFPIFPEASRKNSTPMIDQMPIKMPSTINAFRTPGSEAKIPSMINRSDGILLNRRKTRNARKSLSTEIPGRSENISDIREMSTITKSKMFQPLPSPLQKAHQKLPYIFHMSSSRKATAKNISKPLNMSCRADPSAGRSWASIAEMKKLTPI
jgi:hypothetical protein